jgi:hypothetical protein
MTGLPITVGLSLLFSFQSLHAPCLSAEPDQNRTFRGEQKPTLIRVGRRRSLSLLRSYPSVPPRLSNRFRSLAGELYHLDSGCKPKTKDFCHSLLFFVPTPGPCLSAGCLCVLRRSSASSIVAPLRLVSSSARKISARGDELGVAAFSDLKNFAREFCQWEGAPLICNSFAVDPYGTSVYEAAGLTVGLCELGPFY